MFLNIIVPTIFQHGLKPIDNDYAVMGLINSSYFWAGLLAVVLSITIHHTLLVIILSMLGFYGLRYLGLH